ncbi:bifunctional phosphoglucose/phosphomannose isomerase [bacterium]|nr:bifunctional phosphoglucose/phosphomannose isomerase [bacterium]
MKGKTMVNLLDQMDRRQSLDPRDMIGLVETLPAQFMEGERIARTVSLPPMENVHHIVICGMGGSAIGGDFLKAYGAKLATASIDVIRNYDLPNYVDSNTLVIASSYSGDTEETLSAYRQAKERGAQVLAITTGGQLEALCREANDPMILVPGGFPPRAALGYSFMPLLVTLERLGGIPDQSKPIQALYQTLKQCAGKNAFAVPTQSNAAKQFAFRLKDVLPVIYAGQDAFEPVATRWRCQLNENAKVFAHNMVVPEMNHNEILGWAEPKPLLNRFYAIYLLDHEYHVQTRKRFQVMKPIIESVAAAVSEVESVGDGLLSRMFSLVYFGDFVSVYLAYLYGQDPTPIPAIDELKSKLAK